MKIIIIEDSVAFPLSLMYFPLCLTKSKGYSHDVPIEIRENSENLCKVLAWKNEEKNEVGFYYKAKAVCIDLGKGPVFSISYMTPAKGGGFVSFEVALENSHDTLSIFSSETYNVDALNWLMRNKSLLESLVGSNILSNDYGADY